MNQSISTVQEASSTTNVNHLINRIEDAFIKAKLPTRYNSVSEIIASDENSASFIREVLHDNEYSALNQNNPMYEFAKSRAQHSVLTFFIGLVFLEFCHFDEMIANDVLETNDRTEAVRLWMLTALYHDWGYHSEDVQKPELDFGKITKYDLLTDEYGKEAWLHPIQDFSQRHPSVLAYTYDEIKAYDRYARGYHAKNDNDTERVDHGILSGVKIFERLAKEIRKVALTELTINADYIEKRLRYAKIACLTIAQHNIFKSSNKDKDVEYGDALIKLHSTSSFRISRETPLLLLLSLVDTFECIKRFGQSKNERKYLQKGTILQSIALDVHQESISIDYTELAAKIQEKDNSLRECFTRYKKDICGICSWTVFVVEQVSDEHIVIRLKT